MKITICGSIGFYKEMEKIEDELKKYGHEVKIPELALEVPQEFGGGKKVYFGSKSQYQKPAGFWGADEKQVSSEFFGAAYFLNTFSPNW